MGVSRLATAPGLLDLFLLNLGPHLDNLVLVRRRDARFLQLLLDGLCIGDLDLVPDLLELAVKVLDERGVIGPDHFGVVVLLVPCDEQLPFLLQLIDSLLHIWPTFTKLTDTHSRGRRLSLKLLQQLLSIADVMRRTKAKGAFTVRSTRIVLDLLMHLEDTPERLDVTLIIRTMLEGEVRDDIGKFERDALGLQVLDREKNLRHDVLARAGVCRLRIDDVCIVSLLFHLAGRRWRWRGGWDLRTVGGGGRAGNVVAGNASLLRHAVRRLHHAGVEALELLLEVRHGGDRRLSRWNKGSSLGEAGAMPRREPGRALRSL